jgi:hypothetical protein
MRRREVEVGVCDPGIGGADLNSRQAALAGSLPGSPGQAWVDLDQQRADSVPLVVRGQYRQHIASLAGAHADQSQLPRLTARDITEGTA